MLFQCTSHKGVRYSDLSFHFCCAPFFPCNHNSSVAHHSLKDSPAILHLISFHSPCVPRPHAASLTFEGVAQIARSSASGRALTLDRIRSSLQLLLQHPQALLTRSADSLVGGHYTLRRLLNFEVPQSSTAA